VDLDLSDFDEKIKGLKEQRSQINKEVERLRHEAERIVVADDVPDEMVSIEAMTKELQEAMARNRSIESEWEHISNLDTNVVLHQQEIETLEKQLAEHRKAIEELNGEIAAAKEKAPDKLIDTEALSKKIDQHSKLNAQVQDKNRKVGLEKAAANEAAAYKGKGKEIEALERQKAEALSSVKMPIEGLSVNDEAVTYNGVPIRQISQGEALRVGVAVSMALNPKLRVLRIVDGSLLDSTNLAAIAEMVCEEDFQIWIERCDESGKMGIFIEDGEVVE